jgi:hypothetical protein
MSRRKRKNQKNKFNNKFIKSKPVSKPEQLGDVIVQEEEIIEVKTDVEMAERNPAKPLDKIYKEKIKIMPQTYVEDTFNIHNNEHDDEQKTVIENPIIEKSKKFITRDELLQSHQFKNKLNRFIKNLEFNKNFNDLLDFVQVSKLYRTYHIDETTDEIDVLLHETVLHFKKKLHRIKLEYKDYQTINGYLDNVKILYNKYNHGEKAMIPNLNKELATMKKMNIWLKSKLF